MSVQTRLRRIAFLVGRALFGGMLAYSAYENFANLDGRIQYAESKGVDQAGLLVPLATGSLLFGSLGIVFWRLPRIAAGAVLTFLAGITPQMHDFWNLDGERRNAEQTHFIKNVSLIGAALVFLGVADRDHE